MARLLRTVSGLMSGAAVDLGLLVALVMVLHALFVVSGANPRNVIVALVHRAGGLLIGAFRDLFVVPSRRVETAVNDGVAALAYLAAGVVLGRVLRRLASALER